MSKPNSRTGTPVRRASSNGSRCTTPMNRKWNSSTNLAKASPLRSTSETRIRTTMASSSSNRDILMKSPTMRPARCHSAGGEGSSRVTVANRRSQSLLGSNLNRKMGLMNTPQGCSTRGSFQGASSVGCSGGNSKIGTFEKAERDRENAAIEKKVRQLMRLERPLYAGQSGFRISGTDEDLKMLHYERITRDPNLKGVAIRINKDHYQNHDHMRGILSHTDSNNSSCDRNRRDSTPNRSLRRFYTPCAFRGGMGMVPCNDEPIHKHKRKFVDLNEHVAPWRKEVAKSPQGRFLTPTGREITDIFCLNPIPTPQRHYISRKNMSHDVYRDVEGPTFQHLIHNYPSPRRTGLKNGDLIKEEMANEPPIELPPRRKPAIALMEGSRITHDILNQHHHEPEKTLFGRKIVCSSPLRNQEHTSSNPNDMVEIHPEAILKAPYKSIDSKLKRSNDIIVHKDPPIDESQPRGRKSDNRHSRCNWDRVVTNMEHPSKRDEDRIRFLQSSPYRNVLRTASAKMTSTIAHEPFGSGVDEACPHGPILSVASWSPGIDGRSVSRRKISANYKQRNSTIHNCLSWD